MVTNQKFFYQPDLTTTIINWCWIMMILIVGVIIWLEITVFNPITAIFLIVWLLVASLVLFRRTLVITPTKLIINRIWQSRAVEIDWDSVRHFTTQGKTTMFTVNGQWFTLTMSKRAQRAIQQRLTTD